MKKINEVCSHDDGEETYINTAELELNLATKTRSVSMDVHNRRKAAASS